MFLYSHIQDIYNLYLNLWEQLLSRLRIFSPLQGEVLAVVPGLLFSGTSLVTLRVFGPNKYYFTGFLRTLYPTNVGCVAGEIKRDF